MTDAEFDQAVVEAVLSQAGDRGWRGVNLVVAGRDAGLDLGRLRMRFPSRLSVLMRFGMLADQAALATATETGPTKDRLFDLIMHRIDIHQAHRRGILAVLEAAPFDPLLGLLLTRQSIRSMGWLLEAAGSSSDGARGAVRARGLLGVWLWVIRAWRNDETTDLAPTMSALDQALDRASQAARWIGDGETEIGPEPDPLPDLDGPAEPPGPAITPPG